ncbi:MAG: hypothetical protein WCP92_09450 [bacterium]
MIFVVHALALIVTSPLPIIAEQFPLITIGIVRLYVHELSIYIVLAAPVHQ